MEREQVIETLQSLASGALVDDAQIVDAINTALGLPEKRNGLGDRTPPTAAAHGRKAGGTRARRIKLGRLEGAATSPS